MRERPLCIIVLGFLLGILLAALETKWLLLPVFGIGIFLTGTMKLEKSKLFAYGKLAVYIVSFLCGMYRYEMQQEFRAEYESIIYDGMKIILQGTLEEKEYKNKKYLYYLNNCYLISGTGEVIPCNRVIAEMETDVIPIGTILIMKGSVAVFRQARNQGNFDEISFYQSQNIDFKLKEVEIKRFYGGENRFLEALYQLKQKLKNVYVNTMSEEHSGVLVRMTLGDKSLMNQEMNQLYQKVGISHILAISGVCTLSLVSLRPP